MTYIVFWVRGGRVGSVENTPENLAAAQKEMRLSLIQTDATGTQHSQSMGMRSARHLHVQHLGQRPRTPNKQETKTNTTRTSH